MLSTLTHPDSIVLGRTLMERLDALGVALVRTRRSGQARVLNRAGRAESAIVQSGPFRDALRRQWDRVLKTARDESAFELMPGVWVRALPEGGLVSSGNQLAGVDRLNLVMMLSAAALASEQFVVACDHARLDVAAAQRQVADRLVTPEEAARLALTLGWMSGDDHVMVRRQRELQGLSSELADTYEELSLLYRMSTSLRVNQSASDVIRDACDELHQVVGFSWVAFCLGHNDRLEDVDRATVVVSTREHDRTKVREVADALTEHLREQPGPVILDDTAEMGVLGLEELGKNLLVIPLVIEGEVLGVMFGGDRLDGEMLSSIDAKLCESFAGSLTIYLENHMLYGDAQSMFLGALHALTAAIDAKDSYTHGHSERVALLARMLAEDTGLDHATCERVYLAGLVHDVGKIGVPEAVLCKPGRLTDEEFGLIKLHPQIGATIIKDIRQMQDLVPGVLYHHERYDGRGYPHGLVGEDIPIFGRLIGLADAFDAMSSHRTYRKALDLEDVLEEIRRCAGAQFDPRLAEAFVAMDFTPFHQLIARHERLKKTA
ncbi:MAG: HD domain-containing phosphohydrolase [Planctomycetota bacterium]